MKKYFYLLDENDIKKICNTVPYTELQRGFKHCVKDFSKICKGYRPQGLPEEKGRRLLPDNKNSSLTRRIIEVISGLLVKQIDEEVEKGKNKKIDLDRCYIIAFSKCIIPECVDIYFKLKGKQVSKEYARAIVAGAKIVLEYRKKIASKLSDKNAKLLETERKEAHEKLKDKEREIKEKNNLITELNNQVSDLTVKQEEMKDIKIKLSEAEHYVEKLKEKGSNLKEKIKELERAGKKHEEETETLGREKARLVAENKIDKDNVDALNSELFIYKEQERRINEAIFTAEEKVIMPRDIEEFNECFRINLESLNLNQSNDSIELLIRYMDEILFCGKPIIVNCVVGNTLAGCVANSIFGHKEVCRLTYSSELTSEDIRSVVRGEDKIIVLDNFLGNYDEMQLLSMISGIKNKIFFLTLSYDKTIRYLPEEILVYCNYLNVNNMEDLLQGNRTAEETFNIEVRENELEPIVVNKKMLNYCTDIMKELDFKNVNVKSFSAKMKDETILTTSLLFSLLPYNLFFDEMSPFNKSGHLWKFVANSRYKNIFLRWFGDVKNNR
jgi:hypothetical protein